MQTGGGKRYENGQFLCASAVTAPLTWYLSKIHYNQLYKSLNAGVNFSSKVQSNRSSAFPVKTAASESKAQWTEG